MEDYRVIKREEIYNGKILELVKDTIILPDKRETSRELIIHNGAAAIIAIDGDKIILVNQYRHPAKEMVLEIPAGKIDGDENPRDCAIRELKEETGYTAKNMAYAFKSYQAIGYSTEIIYYYIATDLVKGEQELDDGEFVDIVKMDYKKALDLIKEDKIIDSKTINGILFYNSFVR